MERYEAKNNFICVMCEMVWMKRHSILQIVEYVRLRTYFDVYRTDTLQRRAHSICSSEPPGMKNTTKQEMQTHHRVDLFFHLIENSNYEIKRTARATGSPTHCCRQRGFRGIGAGRSTLFLLSTAAPTSTNFATAGWVNIEDESLGK